MFPAFAELTSFTLLFFMIVHYVVQFIQLREKPRLNTEKPRSSVISFNQNLMQILCKNDANTSQIFPENINTVIRR